MSAPITHVPIFNYTSVIRAVRTSDVVVVVVNHAVDCKCLSAPARVHICMGAHVSDNTH